MLENGNVMSYDTIRNHGRDFMASAGIKDPKSYHMKHAAITALHAMRVQPESIAAFARHKQGSSTWASSYLNTKKGKEIVKKLASVK
jgi:hypothetical protein